MNICRNFFSMLMVFLLSPGVVERVHADALMITRAMTAPTIAEFYIEADHVRVELEIGLGDLPAFKHLLPNELLKKLKLPASPLAERVRQFFAEDLTIRNGEGVPLRGYVVSMEGRRRLKRDDVTGQALPASSEEGEAVIYAVLLYPFEGQPGEMHFKPPMAEDGKRVMATIGFMAYHHGLPITDFRYLSREETVKLDWKDPWYSQFDNRNLRRKYREPISTFLYVEPFEVRAEIIVRPFDLQQWVDLGIEGKSTIPIDQQPELMRKVAEYVAGEINMTIEGQPCTPQLERINFLRRTLRSSTVIDPPEELDVYSATLGVIFVQARSELPQEASITWDQFPPKAERIRSATTDQAGSLPYFLTLGDTTLVWKNFLKHPVIPSLVEVEAPPRAYLGMLHTIAWAGIGVLVLVMGMGLVRKSITVPQVLVLLLVLVGLVGAVGFTGRMSVVDPVRAEAVVSSLMKNVYHAFDFREEERIYDTLARSVEGDLLTRLYLETRKGLELTNQGGARVKVKEVTFLEVAPEPLKGAKGFTARCKWNVRGSVGHWGHIHQRVNQYEALIIVRPVNGAWKIVEVEIIQEERVS